MRGVDHFYAVVELADDSKLGIGGGWTGFPNEWDHMSPVARDFALIRMAAAWADEPINVKKLLSFSLAG